MSFLSFVRMSLAGAAVAVLALLAPLTAHADGNTPGGSYAVTYYNYISDEGGAACPTSGGIPGGVDGALNTFHYWPEGTSPYPGVNVSQYTVCWSGTLTFPSTGNWTVQTVNDDGMDIWVDGQITMRAWYDQGPSLHTGSIYIDASVPHQVIIKYYNNTLGATACVGWGPAGGSIGFWNCPNPLGPAYVPQSNPVASAFPYGQPNPYFYPAPSVQPYPQFAPPPAQPYPYPFPPQSRPPYPSYPAPGYGAPRACIYIVQPGDTLARIAARFGMNYILLAQFNRLPNPNLIYSGMSLVIPYCR